MSFLIESWHLHYVLISDDINKHFSTYSNIRQSAAGPESLPPYTIAWYEMVENSK